MPKASRGISVTKNQQPFDIPQDEDYYSSKPNQTSSLDYELKSTQILVLAATLSSAAAAAVAVPEGRIVTFTVVDCTEASGVTDGVTNYLPLNTCQELTRFLSFKGGIESGCPKGKAATVTAYSAEDCSGTAASASLPSVSPGAVGTTGSCVESPLLGVEAQSSKFTCT